MGWCAHGNALLVPLLFLFVFSFSFYPLAFSKLSSPQLEAMIDLSQKIPSSDLSWNITKEPDPCGWNRTTCSPDNSSVIELSLSGLSLASSDFLPVICQIDSLQVLDLSDNQLSSLPDEFITSCGKIGGLKRLNFSRNALVGPLPSFTGFLGLEFLDLSYNHMRGSTGSKLDGLVTLRSLNLSVNKFDGSVPVKLSRVLEELQLSANEFDGEIPAGVADYQSLTLVDFSQNRLSGSVPDRLGELPKLEVLVLSSNRLSGKIPESLANIPTLSRFSANQNKFSGPIPSGLTRSLKSLDLSYNKLSGSIPSDLLSPPKLQYVDLSYNQLEGPIPNNLSPYMFRLRLGSNSLIGTIPADSLGSLEKLTYLELENNSLTGSVPPELGKCRSLALLSLAQNNLTGPLPPELGNLSSIQVMKLQFNNIDGVIPGQIAQLASLAQLNISWNLLSGTIPSSLTNLRNLTTLNLQHNNLNGSIPAAIGGLQGLLELQLGKNQLSGHIPTMPLSLQIALNLSSNLFDGTIPATFSQLRNLEILDLSDNRFSGSVPMYLTQMPALTQLILSNNLLSGVLPKFRDVVKVEASGNMNLINGTAPRPSVVRKRNSVAVPVLTGLASAVFAMLVVAVVVISVSKRFYRVNDEHLQLGENLPLPQVIDSSLLTSNGIHRSSIDFTKAMEEVSDPTKIVLKTRFSTYYKATMPSGTRYYIKKLNWSDKIFQLGSHDKFGQELEVLGKLNNSNVMTPLAYVLTIDSGYLFYEYAQKGTLFDVLHDSSSELDWASRYSIAVGVAQGLAFLHDCSSGPILLLDLSSRTVLLKSLKEPQVGDIELCKVIDPSKSTGSLSTVAGSIGYIPPEYAYTMRITMAGNVYSFGVMLLELLTGKPACSQGNELTKWVSTNTSKQDKWDHILDFSVSRTSLTVRSQMLAVLRVALACVSISPDSRPKMKSVLRMLLNAR
ncbi:probable leucine-rich repeat receptor-like protein kinase At5g63930 [Syzygium oleosum]|uniref:probable leucine-rich repeat receptor-like protein kinase At5g63930 n=1 Tax=Syzygium oleosum TaxID=219896 RepID=UPI0011D24D34|nr:probable leucine-rich repeat receptor-like protein kinase At5g63930 [Syzygium oleosum]